jgi:hypothetical protein
MQNRIMKVIDGFIKGIKIPQISMFQMLRIISSFTILIATLSATLFSNITFAVEVDTKLKDFENQLRIGFEESVQKVFGLPITAQINATTAKTTLNDNLEVLDTGYMQVPRFRSMTLAAQDQSSHIEVSSLSVEVFINKEISANSEKQIRDYTNTYFAKYNPKTNIKKILIEKPKDEPKRDTASEGADKEKADKEQLEKAEAQKAAMLNFVIIGAALVLGSALLFAALFYFSKSFSNALSQLSGSLLGLKQSPPKEAPKVEAPPQKELKEIKNDQTGFDKETVSANISIVKQLLKSYPSVFIKALGLIKDSQAGLKWLLPQFDDTERTQVRSLVGDDFFTTKQETSEDFQPWTWLQNFSENIVVSQLTSHNDPLQVFSKEEIKELLQWQKASVSKIARESNDMNIWSIAKQILNTTELNEATKSLSATGWSAFLKGLTADKEVLKSGYQQLKSKIGTQATDPQAAAKMDDLKKLLPQLVESVKKMAFGQEKGFIDEVVRSEPTLKSLIEESVWTSEKLMLVPEQNMRSFLQNMDTESAFSLIISVPESTKNWLKSLIPEGNRKILIQDLLTKAEKRFDDKNKNASHQIARALVDQLMAANQRGDFKLKDQASTTSKTEAAA